MVRSVAFVVALALAACSPAKPAANAAKPPATRTVEISDTYFGEAVADPYRWLEDWNDPEVKTWSAAQSAFTRKYLDAMPERAAVHERVSELVAGGNDVFFDDLTWRAVGLFAIKTDSKLQQAYLVLLPSAAEPEKARTIIDPNTLDPSGGTSIDWYRVSNDGKTIAVSISSGGSEAGDLHFYDTATAKDLGEVITRVQGGTAGGDAAWLPDDTGIFYTRYPHDGEHAAADLTFFQQVWFHKRGDDPSKDTYVLGKDFPRIGEARLFMEKAGRLLISVQDGDSSRFAHWLRGKDGKVTQVSKFEDKLADLAFAPDGRLVGLSWAKDPKGEIVALPAKAPTAAAAKTLVAASDGAIGTAFYELFSPAVSVIGDRLYVVYQVGGPTELRVFDLAGKRVEGPRQAPVATIIGVTDMGPEGAAFATMSYTILNNWSAFDPKTGATRDLAITSRASVDFSDVEVVREEAVSKDGTKIPVNIMMPRAAKADGTRGIIVTGYGGYNLSTTPSFSRSRHIVFENGMLFAEANLRGGNEFGEAWHRGGMLTNKQNVFDDFIAVTEYLVAKGYAAKDKVAIIGGSNGGLLMGAVITQRPDLAQAVVSHVGIYDVLRYVIGGNGVFNVPELGSVEDEAQYKAMRAYSPYHNVKAGTHYPAVLFPTGANDPRVNPLHSRKFTAALQAAQAGDAPILLRAEENSGHGASTLDQLIETNTDQYAFIFHQLKIPVEQKTAKPAN